MMTEQEQALLAENIARVRERVAEAAIRAGRRPEEVALLAATKMNSAERVRFAVEHGISVCGENRVQELLEKYEQSAYGGADLQFIGTLQTNKVKYLIGKVSLIQSVGSLRLAQAIDREAGKRQIRQDVLLEVNIGKEAAKSGFSLEELGESLDKIAGFGNLSVKGLMAIPPVTPPDGNNLYYFHEMHQLFIDISTKKYDNVCMACLSMGMTNDFEDAISCGSTMIRVGTAIFGARDYGKPVQGIV